MNRNCMLVCKKDVTIGNGTTIGPNVMIFDHDHRITINHNAGKAGFTTDEISIGDNVWIGANAVILKGTHIGNNCVIAAGTVIKGDIPESKIVYQERILKLKDIK